MDHKYSDGDGDWCLQEEVADLETVEVLAEAKPLPHWTCRFMCEEHKEAHEVSKIRQQAPSHAAKHVYRHIEKDESGKVGNLFFTAAWAYHHCGLRDSSSLKAVLKGKYMLSFYISIYAI